MSFLKPSGKITFRLTLDRDVTSTDDGPYAGRMSSAIEAAGPVTRFRAAIRSSTNQWASPVGALVTWAVLIAVAAAWGAYLNARGEPILLHAAPLFGKFDLRLGLQTLVPVSVGALVIVWAPTLARTLSWRRLLVVAPAGAALWGLALALNEGTSAIIAPVLGRHDYIASLPMAADPAHLLTEFVERLPTFTIHAQGHPPGMFLMIWALASTTLPIAATTTAVIVIVGASTAAAVLIAARTIAGETFARSAAPFICFAPVAVWAVTSADGLFMGVAAWSVALFALATRTRSRWTDAAALASGALFGIGMMMSYGILAVAGVFAAIAMAQGRLRPLMLAVAGVAAVLFGVALAGFWWLDGLEATRTQYLLGAASSRPYGFFFVSNLAAFSLALGPAVFIALGKLDDRGMRFVMGAALTGVLLANLSGLSKGEVERIWLPFTPWLLVACGSLPSAIRRWALSLQVWTAIAIQVMVRTPW